MNLNSANVIKQYNMLPHGTTVIVGVSGGADSMCLLHLLFSLKDEFDLKVFVAHINHGLRSEEADRDEKFVRDACTKLSVELFVLNADVKSEAKKNGESFEQAGRRVRYNFFEELAIEKNAKIATAHTLSDSMETILINLARGTGLKGVCGIPPVRDNIIRPLITDTRQAIEEYCENNNIEYITDSTNFSKVYARNKIRLDVIPTLYEINPAFDKTLQRFINNLTIDESFLSQMATIKLECAKLGENIYDTNILSKLETSLKVRAVAFAIKISTGIQAEAVHIDKVCDILDTGGKVQIKGGFFAISQNNKLHFSMQDDSNLNNEFEFKFTLREGVYENRHFTIEVYILNAQNINKLKIIHKDYFNIGIDCDKIECNTFIRNKKDGDSYRPAGRKLTKTLKKLFNEAKLQVELRSSIPVVANANGIVWVYGFGADERYQIDENTKRAYIIKVSRLELENE
jgi:tRNA(Ile)-lysidine synthase